VAILEEMEMIMEYRSINPIKTILVVLLSVLFTYGCVAQFGQGKFKELGYKEYSKIVFKQCNKYVSLPHKRKYKLVPNVKWFKQRTPFPGDYVPDYNDCFHAATRVSAAFGGYAVGTVIVDIGREGTSHAMNIVIFSNKTVLYYDSFEGTFERPDKYTVISIWI
jgi:hypothetical protein